MRVADRQTTTGYTVKNLSKIVINGMDRVTGTVIHGKASVLNCVWDMDGLAMFSNPKFGNLVRKEQST